MRRNLNLVVILLLSIFTCVKVNAELIECEYKDLELTMTYDTEKEFNKKSNPYVKMGDYESNSQPINLGLVKWGKKLNNTDATDIKQGLYKEALDNYGCPSNFKACVYIERSLDSVTGMDFIDALIAGDWDKVDGVLNFTSKFAIMTDEEYKESDYGKYIGGGHYFLGIKNGDGFLGNVWNAWCALSGWGDEDIYAYRESTCQTVIYDGPYIGVNINCTQLKASMLQYMMLIKNYRDCKENDASCKSKSISNIKEKENVIKNHCSQILQSYDYADGQKACIDECMKIKSVLNEYKEGTDLYDDGSNRGDCGFSARLLAWISNVLRWIKYLLPVVVIVLGILDFIKAIASGKDDEMKKAQGSFTRRLIAAALVFIIPLIIEFVLDKMGFGYDTCGLF